MKKTQILVFILVLGLLFGVAIGPALAQEEQPPQSPTGEISLQGAVSNKFIFQGSLSRGGSPLSGTPDMTFRLYTDDACTLLLSGTITIPDVPVTDGLFTVELSFSAAYFNGQALWLRTTVDGTTVGCQEILPVPYALSLRPGAEINGIIDELLVLDQTQAGAGDYDTLIVRNNSDDGEAVEIAAVNTALYASSSGGYGVIGVSTSATGVGILAKGYGSGTDLVIGGDGASDDGIISSDPSYPSSDLFFFANDGVVIRLDYDGEGEDADLEVRDKDNVLLFNIDESGAITYGGAGIAAFPRPAYDSGWTSMSLGGTVTLTHSLGGDIDNYVVDMTCKHSTSGINNWGLGGDANYDEYYGAWYTNLTATSITLRRWGEDTDCPQARIRIWMYP